MFYFLDRFFLGFTPFFNTITQPYKSYKKFGFNHFLNQLTWKTYLKIEIIQNE